MTFLWVILGIIGGLVLFLVLNDGSTTFGLQNSEFAEVALLSMWGAIIAAAIIPRQGSLKIAARNAAIWLFIVLLLTAGYIFRYDLQDLGSKFTAGLIPGSVATVQGDDGVPKIVLSRTQNGHFVAKTSVNGAAISMLVDTGATAIVLTEQDAEAVGIDINSLSFSVPVSTANGTAQAAQAKISSIEIGTIRRDNLRILVSQEGALDKSLLGMTFLNSLTSFEFRGGRLYLTD